MVRLPGPAAAALAAATLAATPAAALSIRTLLIGDSITAGIVGGPPAPSYADLTAAALPANFDVLNIGQGGASVRKWLPGFPCYPACPGPGSYFDDLVEPALPVEIVTILLGTNDALGFLIPEPTDPALYRAQLRELTDALFQGGARDLLLMTPPQLSAAAIPDIDSHLQGYRNAIFGLSAGNPNIHLGPDLYALIDPIDDFDPADNIHPNAAGHSKIADALVQAIRVLPEPGTRVLLAIGVICAASAPPRPTLGTR
jgi:lysophospholipase L1-like esterase